VTDAASSRIRKVVPIASTVTTIAAAAQFNDPTGIAIDSAGNIYVADTGNDTVRRIGSDGTVSTIAGASGAAGFSDGQGAAARFNAPAGLAFDRLGNLYVADTGNHAIRRIAPSGLVSTVIGTSVAGHANGPSATATLNQPAAVAFDAAGRLFIADRGNDVIRVATPVAPALLSPPARHRAVHS